MIDITLVFLMVIGLYYFIERPVIFRPVSPDPREHLERCLNLDHESTR